MEIKDTLTLYNEFKASGMPEEQAQIQAHQLGALSNTLEQSMITLRSEMFEIKTWLTKIDKDMHWMRIIGAAMTVTFFSNGFFMWLSK